MIVFLFGLLGAGKNFVGKIFAEEFGFTFYDADQDLPAAMKEAIAGHREFTDRMRDEYFEIVIGRIAELKKNHKRLAIAQALFKNRNRQQILSQIPEIKFVWVQSDEQFIGRRLETRKDHPAGKSYGEMVNKLFELPNIPYEVLVNNSGKEAMVERIAILLAGHETSD
jgi:gluconokinase